MRRLQPDSTLTDTLFPYTTRFRSPQSRCPSRWPRLQTPDRSPPRAAGLFRPNCARRPACRGNAMPSFLNAHGFDPSPTQRPVLAGILAGVIGTAPATAVLVAFGSLEAEAEILDLSVGTLSGAGCGAMALAGGIYGRLFQRGANDRRGGWLFGMAFGFLLWTAGMVLTLPLLSGGRLRSEEHTSELQSLMRISYAVFCLSKKLTTSTNDNTQL